ncbi:MAG: hypothetical protein NC182_04410 [Prevotella sp.]|nr:hypothetical protein [Staphylococcus sp.]MCM1350425.1 hypothetical protein [Prevotella sp.]
MNLPKKSLCKLKWMIGIGVLILSIGAIITTILRRKEIYQYLTYPNIYYLSTEEDSIKVKLYSRHEIDPYLQKANITNLSLEASQQKDHYTLSIEQIVPEQEYINYQKQKYRTYTLNLHFPFDHNGDLQIHNANLVFEFVYGEKFKIPIGSIICYTKGTQDVLRLANLKGVVEEKEDLQVLTGIGITLYHIENHSFQLKKIESIDKRVIMESNTIMELNTTRYPQNTSLLEIEENYCRQIHASPFNIDASDQVHLFFPITYHDLETITTMALLITYQEDGVTYTQVFEPFQFFKTTSITYNQVKYVPNSN